jgi:broad specificity phosphatase PhoE
MALPKIKKTIYSIRHPKVLGMAGKCYGQYDAPFDPEFYKDEVLNAIKEKLPKDLMVYKDSHFDSRLMEISFGQWENQSWDDIPKERIDDWVRSPLHFSPPEGESFIDFRKRVYSFLKDLIFPQNLLVTHSGVIKCLYHLLEGESLSEITSKKIPWLSIHEFKFSQLQDEVKEEATNSNVASNTSEGRTEPKNSWP